jgi:predicted ATPase
MLTQIKLTNFKCFKEETAFPLSKLNLLTGINGQGKSTLLQSLLLMQQSIEHNEITTQILLNGSCVNLGNFDDVKNRKTPKNEPIVFGYDFANQEWSGNIEYHLSENRENDMVADINNIFVSYAEPIYDSFSLKSNKNTRGSYASFLVLQKGKQYKAYLNKLIPEASGEEPLCLNGSADEKLDFTQIHYISANRLGSQDFYFKSTLTQFPNVGVKGELTANVLSKNKDNLVHEKLQIKNIAPSLFVQTGEWLNNIFDNQGIKVIVEKTATNIIILSFKLSQSQSIKPANVGFGYNYVLPIIVSGLIAKEGEILIVENPEAYLHPKAQSQLAKFLAKVSSRGVQVFIESHSEHILNGIRVATLRADIDMSNEEVSVLYFQNPKTVVQLPIEKDGSIKNWVDGFFDQQELDLSEIFKLGRANK